MKEGQAWGFDVMVGASIFVAALVLLYFYGINNTDDANEVLRSLEYDGNVAADILLSEGSPSSWTSTNVISPGLLNNGKINDTKLQQFYNLSQTDYSRSRALLQIRYNYFFNFSQPIVLANGTALSGIGRYNNTAQQLLKIARVATYKNSPVTMEVYLWN